MKLIKLFCVIFLLKIKMVLMSQNMQQTYILDTNYNKHTRPNALTDVTISLYINRISSVDENNEEITFDLFLEVIWEDLRVKPKTEFINSRNYIELQTDDHNIIWKPDLYIRQLKEMKIMKLFDEISSLRLYDNSTIIFRIRATIIIKCDMDFVLYPLDVQRCPVDFSSYKYARNDMRYHWKEYNPIKFPNDSGDGFFRLPKYIVSFSTEKEPILINYGAADHWSARLEVTLSREVKSYLLEYYLPSTLFVSISWGSFLVPSDIVPGRMVLLVTTLLSLITMFDTVRNNSPNSLELKCLEVWIMSCIFFVFFALIEYFIVLFSIRYDKNWRRIKKKIQKKANQILSPKKTQASTLSTSSSSGVQGQQRKNNLENATRMLYSNSNKVSPENKAKQSKRSEDAITSILPVQSSSDVPHRKRLLSVAEDAVLYTSSHRDILDEISLVLFPLSFLLFIIIYWIHYTIASRTKV